MKKNKNKSIYIGIDPGANGAIAAIIDNTVFAEIFSEETFLTKVKELAKYAKKNKYAINCVLEKVSARPGQGVVSMFNFGCNFGFIQGVLKANKINYNLVTPQKWKKEMGVTSEKNTSIDAAKKIFPEVDLRATTRCKKDHDGKAEALLLAEYARTNC